MLVLAVTLWVILLCLKISHDKNTSMYLQSFDFLYVNLVSHHFWLLIIWDGQTKQVLSMKLHCNIKNNDTNKEKNDGVIVIS